MYSRRLTANLAHPAPHCWDCSIYCFQREFDVLFRVRKGNKQIFKRIRMEKHTLSHHFFPPDAEEIFTRMMNGVAVITDMRVGEPNLKNRPKPNDFVREARGQEALTNTSHEGFTPVEQLLVNPGLR